MFCPNCGAENKDSAVFCAECGKKITFTRTNQVHPTINQNGANGTGSSQSSYQPGAIANSPFIANDPVTSAVKSFCGSTEALVMAICFTLAIVLPLFNGGFGSAFLKNYGLDDFLDFGNNLEYIIGFNIFGIFNTIITTATIIASIPDILIAIGLWITVASGLDKVKNFISTAGLTMIEIIFKIQAVLIIISGGMFALIMIFLIFATIEEISSYNDFYDSLGFQPSYSQDTSTLTMLIVLLVIGLAIVAFLVWCKLQYSTLANNIKFSANTKKPLTLPVSCVVLTIISTVGVAISLIFTINVNSFFGGFGFSIFGMLCTIVANIMFVVLITKYNDVMSKLKFQTSTLLGANAQTNNYSYR